MATERFDIEVRDLIAKSIRTELKAIGTEARSTHTLVQQMNRELAAGSRAAAQGAQTAAAQASSAASQQAAASARASAEAARAAVQASQTRRAAYQQEEAALKSLNAQRVIHNQTVVAQSGNPGGALAGSRATVARQTVLMGGGRGPGSGDPATDPQVARTATANARAISTVGSSSTVAARGAAQMSFQLNDIFVSLASGQKPMTVFIQQGAQIAQLPMQMGMTWKEFGSSLVVTMGLVRRTGDEALDAAAAAAKAVTAAVASADAQAGAAVLAAEAEVALATAQARAATTANQQAAASARLATANQALASANAEAAITAEALAAAQAQSATATAAAEEKSVRGLSRWAKGGVATIAVLTALGLATAALTREANQGETGLKHYTTEMGYTAKEVAKLNAVQVTFGDTMKAVFQVGARNIMTAFGINADNLAKKWQGVMSTMASATRATLAGIWAAAAGTVSLAGNITKDVSKGELSMDTFTRGYVKEFNRAQGFFDDVIKQAQANARAGQDEMAAGMFNAPRVKKAKEPKAASGWNRAEEWRKANEELDIQIGMLGKYGDELERAQQIEQIGRQFREHNAPLNAAEVKILDDKIKALQEGRRVQEAMTAAEEAANGPARQLAATQEALDKLMASGAITTEDYRSQMALATRAFEDATDPLAALNRELQKTGELMGKYGRDRDVASYIQQLEDAAQAQGKTIYQRGRGSEGVGPNGEIVVTGGRRGGLTPEAQTMVDEFRRQQESGEMEGRFEEIDPREQRRQENTTNFILDNYKRMYAQIDEWRQEDVISEEEANERKKNLDTALGQARLEAASGVFGQLAELQNSQNKRVAAIGKAAAMAQATIDGIAAVQAALKGPPGPPWSFAIAGVTGAMTAMNIAKIAGVGFQRGGYTGDGYNGDVAGPAHRQEFIMDAFATRRIGVPALEALRTGARLNTPAPANENRAPRVSVYPAAGVYTEVVERSDGEIEVIAERVARKVAPGAVAADLNNPNGRVSKSMQTNLGVRRNRA